jgi:ribosomal protein S8
MTHTLSNFVVILNKGARRRLIYAPLPKFKLGIEIISLLYKLGIIRGFSLSDEKINVFYKYYLSSTTFYKVEVVSTPGHKVYWRLGFLSKKYKKSSFAGFYIISTPFGLLTSTECLLYKRISGEVILKVWV